MNQITRQRLAALILGNGDCLPAKDRDRASARKWRKADIRSIRRLSVKRHFRALVLQENYTLTQ